NFAKSTLLNGKLIMKSNETKLNPTQTLATNLAAECVASCQRLIERLKTAKAGILSEFRQNLRGNRPILEPAINEPEAQAWQEGFALLLFPTLAAEKAREVAAWQANQQLVRGVGPRTHR